MANWPPNLTDLKTEMSIEDNRDDARLQSVLEAAIEFVERVRGGDFDFENESESDLPSPTQDIRLGTMRLAWRWHIRRQSPDALVNMAELGQIRIPNFDPDIERLLGIGKFARMRFA